MALNTKLLNMARSSSSNSEEAKQRLFKMLDSDAQRFEQKARSSRPSKKQLVQHCSL